MTLLRLCANPVSTLRVILSGSGAGGAACDFRGSRFLAGLSTLLILSSLCGAR